MERLIILVKYVAPTKYFFEVPLIGRFMPLVGVIRRPVESLLNPSEFLDPKRSPFHHLK